MKISINKVFFLWIFFICFFCNSQAKTCYKSDDGKYYLCGNAFWRFDCEKVKGMPIYEADKPYLKNLKKPSVNCICK